MGVFDPTLGMPRLGPLPPFPAPGLSSPELQAQADILNVRPAPVPQVPASDYIDQGPMFVRALHSGLEDLGAQVPALVGVAGNVISPHLGDPALRYAQGMQRRAAELAPPEGDWSNVHGAGQFLGYLGAKAGELGPSLATIALSGGAGGAIAKGVAKRAVTRAAADAADAAEEAGARYAASEAGQKAAMNAVGDSVGAMSFPEAEVAVGNEAATRALPRATQLVAKQAAPAVAKAAQTGEYAGSAAAMYPGSLAASIEGAPDAHGNNVGGLLGADQGDTLKLAAGNALGSFIGAALPAKLMGRLHASPAAAVDAASNEVAQTAQKYLPTVAKAVAGHVGVGAAANAAMTATQFATHKWVNDNVDLMSPQALSAYYDSAIAGGALGGVLGGGIEAVKNARLNPVWGKRLSEGLANFAEMREQALNKAKGAAGQASDAVKKYAEQFKAAPPPAEAAPAAASAPLNNAAAAFNEHLTNVEGEPSSFETGAPAAVEAPRAVSQNPYPLGSKLQDLLATFIPKDAMITVRHADNASTTFRVWGHPAEFRPIMASVEKVLGTTPAEDLTAQDIIHMDALRTAAPDVVSQWEAAAGHLKAGGLWDKVAAAHSDTSATPVNSAMSDALTRAQIERSARAGTDHAPNVDQVDTTESEQGVGGKPVDENLPGLRDRAASPTALREQLTATPLGTPEHDKLQQKYRAELLRNGALVTGHAHSPSSMKVLESKLAGPGVVEIEGGDVNRVMTGKARDAARRAGQNPDSVAPVRNRQLVELGNLLTRPDAAQRSMTDGTPLSTRDAVLGVLGDLRLAGVKVKPETLRPGAIKNNKTGEVIGRLTANDVRALRGELQRTEGLVTEPAAKSRASAGPDTSAPEEVTKGFDQQLASGNLGREDKHVTREAPPQAVNPRTDKLETSQSGVFDVRHNQPYENELRALARKKALYLKAKAEDADPRIVAAARQDMNDATHALGLKVAEAHYRSVHGENERAVSKRMAQLHKPENAGQVLDFVRRAQHGEFDDTKVIEQKADEAREQPVDFESSRDERGTATKDVGDEVARTGGMAAWYNKVREERGAKPVTRPTARAVEDLVFGVENRATGKFEGGLIDKPKLTPHEERFIAALRDAVQDMAEDSPARAALEKFDEARGLTTKLSNAANAAGDVGARAKAELDRLVKKGSLNEVSREQFAKVAKAIKDAVAAGHDLHDTLTSLLPHANEFQKRTIKALLDSGALKGAKVTAKAVDGTASKLGVVAGTYDKDTRTAAFDLPTTAAGAKHIDPMSAVIHEATHAATAYMVETNPAFRNRLQGLLKQAKAQAGADAKNYYGFVNAHEFVAEAFGSADFQAKLRAMPSSEGTSIWQRFVASVAKALGIELKGAKARNMLSDVLEAGAVGARAYGHELRTGERFGPRGGAPTPRTPDEKAEAAVPPSPSPVAAPIPPSDADVIDRMRTQARDNMTPDQRAILDRALDNGRIIKQLQKIYADDPAARKAMLDGKTGFENRVAYAFDAYQRGQLKIGGRTLTIFNNMKDNALSAAGLAGDGQFARRIFDDYAANRIENSRQAWEKYDVRELEAKDRGSIQRALNTGTKLYADVSAPLKRVFYSSAERLRTMGVPALNQLAAQLHLHTGEAGEDRGLISSQTHTTDRFMQALDKAFGDLDAKGQRDLMTTMQMGRFAQGTSPEVQAAVERMRSLMKRADEYMKGPLGTNTLKDFFPVVMDIKNDADRAALVSLLSDPRFENGIREAMGEEGKPATGDIKQLIEQMADVAQHNTPRTDAETGADPVSPRFRSQNARLMQFVYRDGDAETARQFAALQTKDPALLATRYFMPMVKAVESAKRFGKNDEHLDALLKTAKEQGATDENLAYARYAVDAARGRVGLDGSPVLRKLIGANLASWVERPGFRKASSYAQAYQNARLLPLSLLSSIVDPMGIAVRTGGDFKTAWNGFKLGMKSLVNKSTREELHGMLQSLGSADEFVASEILNNSYGNNEEGGARRFNNWLFKVNGLAGWTKATRYMALQSAHGFLLKHATMDNVKSQRYMDELGVRAGDVHPGANGRVKVLSDAERVSATPEERERDTRVRHALMRFVDEAILRPNSQQAPGWMADPYVGMVAQYKAFAYAIYDQIGGRIEHELKYGNPSIVLPALSYLPIVAMSEMIRSAIQYGPGGNPQRQDWGPKEYAGFAFLKSGLAGPEKTFGIDTVFNNKYGSLPGSSFLGPSYQQAGDVAKTLTGQRSIDATLKESAPGAAIFRHWKGEQRA